MFRLVGDCPPPKHPRIDEEQPDKFSLAIVKSPKSVAFPVVAIVIKSIEFEIAVGEPLPANKPRVELEHLPSLALTDVKSPKSVAFPSVEVVTNSILLVAPGFAPPANIDLVGELQLQPEVTVAGFIRSPKSCAFAVDAIVI